MTRKKKIKKVLYWILITILLFVIGLATIILYPQPLFANKIEYRQFKVYSNEKIGDEIKPILESTNETVNTVRGTTLFVSENLVEPIMKLNSYVAALSSVMDTISTVTGLGRRK